MQITYESISGISRTTTCKLPLSIGESFGVHSWGIQPTFGMTADDMGFETFIMTVSWSRKNRMIPMSEIDDDIKSLMSAAKIQLDDWLNKSVEELSSRVNSMFGNR